MSPNKAAPLVGILGILGVIAGLALDNFPDGTMDDAAVAHWFDEHGTGLWMVSGFEIGLGGALLLVFAAVLAARFEAVGDGPVSRHLTQTAATAWATMTMVGGALWLAVPVAVSMFGTKPTASLMDLAGPAYAVLVSVCAFAAAVLAACPDHGLAAHRPAAPVADGSRLPGGDPDADKHRATDGGDHPLVHRGGDQPDPSRGGHDSN